MAGMVYSCMFIDGPLLVPLIPGIREFLSCHELRLIKLITLDEGRSRIQNQGWGAGLAGKNTHCLRRRPEFSSQHFE